MTARTGAISAAALVWLALVAGAPEAHGAGWFSHPRLFEAPSIRQVSISPTGEWIVALVRHEDVTGVMAQRRGDAVAYPILRSAQEVEELTWVGADTLLLLHPTREPRSATAVRLRQGAQTIDHEKIGITRRGHLVSSLIDQDEVVLWGSTTGSRSRVHRTSISALSGRGADEPIEVASLPHYVSHWLPDQTGTIRVALTERWRNSEPTFTIWHRAGKGRKWASIWKGRDPERLVLPLGFTDDGARLIVAARAGENTRGLHEYDPTTREFGRVVFRHPDVDVVSVLFDHDGADIIAAVHLQDGQPRFEYLDAFREKHLSSIASLAPDESVHVTSSSRDHAYFSLLAHGARNPGVHYFYAKETGEWKRLGETIPGLPPERLVPVHALDVVSADGTELEAFLAMPRTEDGEPAPLLVVPHGGPIGIADDTTFDPLVQYVALKGIAVLKVNYRGSGGYGLAFENAGRGEWGRGIEDDIDAAVQLVIDRGLVDPDRMCIAGGSYGGFSALASAIRHPDRYRCVATINGVTDVPLMFQGSDFSHFKYWTQRFAEVVGDPEQDFARLVEISPVYHVDRLKAPVLIAHGAHDVRVDPEHAHRLKLMLDAYGKPYEWLVFREAGHGLSRDQLWRFSRTLRTFLLAHLGPTSPHVAGP